MELPKDSGGCLREKPTQRKGEPIYGWKQYQGHSLALCSAVSKASSTTWTFPLHKTMNPPPSYSFLSHLLPRIMPMEGLYKTQGNQGAKDQSLHERVWKASEEGDF